MISETSCKTPRLYSHLLSSLVGFGRSTITQWLCTQGKVGEDWSADYRFYSHQRVDPMLLLDEARLGVESLIKPHEPLVVGMDDTLLRKRGRKIAGVAYRRDPLGPPFGCNLVLGQRFIQLSAAVPQGDGSARLIPIDFHHAPTPTKPSIKADEAQWQVYRKDQARMKLSQVAVERMSRLRQQTQRPVHLLGDGGYTNKTVLKNLPQAVTFIGRIRKDAQLYTLPLRQPTHGRKRRYGTALPTPEELRQDPLTPWKIVSAFACGKHHSFKIKTISPIRIRMDGGIKDHRLVVIAPLAYRPRRGSRLLYRQPAYLICSDPNLALQTILQEYLWRWDIEVNFRDEKTLLGVGQAQVRNTNSIEMVPQFQVAAYSWLLLSSLKTSPTDSISSLPLPKWRKSKPPVRPTTSALINQLRHDLWAHQITHFPHFVYHPSPNTKSHKCRPNLFSSVCYSAN